MLSVSLLACLSTFLFSRIHTTTMWRCGVDVESCTDNAMQSETLTFQPLPENWSTMGALSVKYGEREGAHSTDCIVGTTTED
uniref:Putative secreted protein n=1 Tax=Anopheles darlingi TaxID=43151 RepID=A0A2M4DIC9_ANODA